MVSGQTSKNIHFTWNFRAEFLGRFQFPISKKAYLFIVMGKVENLRHENWG